MFKLSVAMQKKLSCYEVKYLPSICSHQRNGEKLKGIFKKKKKWSNKIMNTSLI